MGFYEEIAPYYDEIFPAGEERLRFIASAAGLPPRRILDVACGTGLYSVRLSQQGYEVWGCDADSEMIRQARQKAESLGADVRFFIADMAELDLSDSPDSDEKSGRLFDIVFCIGNSIVHLKNEDEVKRAVASMKKQLLPHGSLLLQIINFDRVLRHGITSLPTIRNDEKGIIFQRTYELDETSGLIHFDTVLTLNGGNDPVEFSNRVDLLPLVSDTLRNILESSGFGTIKFYGDFNKADFDPDKSFMLVAEASGI